MTEPSVDAYEDPDWDGAWVACPHCQWESGVTYVGKKECMCCGKTFEVNPGPLVKQPGDVHQHLPT